MDRARRRRRVPVLSRFGISRFTGGGSTEAVGGGGGAMHRQRSRIMVPNRDTGVFGRLSLTD